MSGGVIGNLHMGKAERRVANKDGPFVLVTEEGGVLYIKHRKSGHVVATGREQVDRFFSGRQKQTSEYNKRQAVISRSVPTP